MRTEKPYQATGTDASWYRGWDLTDEERATFRKTSIASQAAKARAMRGECTLEKHPIPVPRLCPETLMPQLAANQLRALSLFSGGGGLDIGFERAGFTHVASYEIREDAADVLRKARPEWSVQSGASGDVCNVQWDKYEGTIDVLHGGPPCQPFSHAGNRSGPDDVRDMFPELIRAVKGIQPRAFVAENVSGLATKKFRSYVSEKILEPLCGDYKIRMFSLEAADFGVPQKRRRVFFVGFRSNNDASTFEEPSPTHRSCQTDAPAALCDSHAPPLRPTLMAREALGLSDIGFDSLAPTIRSGFSGPRHTTSVVNSVTSLRTWQQLAIWPNGVAEDRGKAAAFVARNGHYRLSIPDCMVLQGFPGDWPFRGAVYRSLGLIGNSVAPPMAYHVAAAVARALSARDR